MKNFARRFLIAVCAVTFVSLPLVASAQLAPRDASAGKTVPRNFDVRLNSPATAASVSGQGTVQLQAHAQSQKDNVTRSVNSFRARVPGSDVHLSAVTGAVEVVRGSGPLTQAGPGQSGADIVRQFISSNSELYGLNDADVANLHFVGESVSHGSGLRMVRVEQMVNGRPVFESESRFTMDRDGRLARSVGLLIPKASEAAAPLTGLISAADALTAAMRSVNISLNASRMSSSNASADGAELELIASDVNISGVVKSKLVYFAVAPGSLIPAWSQVTFTSGRADWYTLVDARTGTLLWRKNIRDYASAQDARFRVYLQADGVTPADNPSPLSPTTATVGSGLQGTAISPMIVSMHTAYDPVASQNGWIDDCPGGVCTANQTQTIGNNVHAYMDRTLPNNIPDTDAASVLDGNGKPTGNPDANGRNRDFLGTTPRDFQTNFLPPPQGGNPEAGQTSTGDGNNGTLAIDQFRRGVITQLFYVANWYHDRLYELGFDEAAGNFQQTNFSGMGLGNDRVLAEAQDNTGTDNSNFSTPPDGQSGRAQMYRFIGPTINRDGALDSEILIHELTHGTSNRLVGNATGLIWDPGAGMGEGWSDFYALSLLNNTNADDPNGKYAMGAYATYKLNGFGAYTDNYLYGIRRFPYCTDNTVDPLTWADVDDYTNNLSGGIAPDPNGFNFGGGSEVHNIGEVWCLTLWEVRSRIIAANSNSVPSGNQVMLQLVTDALKMTPNNPSFTDARDALLDADAATNASANEASIWSGFADRGLGYGAKVSTNYGFAPIASHQGILESFNTPYLDIQSITVDDSSGNNNGAIDAGEPIKLTVVLKNPWLNAAKGVSSATATLSSSTAGIVIYTGNATYGAIPAQGNTAGSKFLLTVPTNAVCGSSISFNLAVTSSLGTQSVPFTLRVGSASGTGAPVTYTRTPGSAIAIPDVQPRGVVDSMSITDDFVISHLSVRIDSITHTFPDDLTVGFKSPGGYGVDVVSFLGAAAGQGAGANMTNMVIDDAGTGDILVATDAQAPYTGSWLPVFNSPTWPVVGFGPQDPVLELSPVEGTSTKGTWQFLVSDQQPGDTGSINAWSLIVTPTAFTCSGISPSANVTGTQTVSGSFTEDGIVTYTVVLTNNASGVQSNNPGDEFTEVLPNSLTLQGASASSGAATTGGNTVHWNGSLFPAGGTVTITITAQIKTGTAGSTILAQGTVFYDADENGTNESSRLTDDPSTPAANDPTKFTIPANNTGKATGSGTIFTHGNQARFNFTANNKNSAPLTGSITYTDSAGGIVLTSTQLLTLKVTGNSAQFTGNGTIAPKKAGKPPIPVSFGVQVTDNGPPALKRDVFAIQISGPYNSSGTLTSGDIAVK